MPKRDLTIAMVGAGGDGIVTMGDILSQAAARDGLNVMKTEAYGPQIRGGESSCVVRISADPIYEQGDAVDVLVVFSWADFGRFKGEVLPAKNAVVLFDEADPVARTARGPRPRRRRALDRRAVREARRRDSGAKGSKNLVGLGVLTALFGLPVDTHSPRRRVTASGGRRRPSAKAP